MHRRRGCRILLRDWYDDNERDKNGILCSRTASHLHRCSLGCFLMLPRFWAHTASIHRVFSSPGSLFRVLATLSGHAKRMYGYRIEVKQFMFHYPSQIRCRLHITDNIWNQERFTLLSVIIVLMLRMYIFVTVNNSKSTKSHVISWEYQKCLNIISRKYKIWKIFDCTFYLVLKTIYCLFLFKH